MKSLDVDKKALLRDVQIREHPLWAAQYTGVRGLIAALRSIDGPVSINGWHDAALRSVSNGEGELRGVRRQADAVRLRLRSETSPAGRKAGSDLLAAMAYEKDTIVAGLTLVRTLADALVWRMLDYNRAAIAVLGEGTATRHLASPEGLAHELATIDKLTGEGMAVVHSDLTTCIRHGDLLCLDQWSPPHWRIIECKAGRGGGDRKRRQHQRIARVEQLMNDGMLPGTEDEDELLIVRCPIRLRAHHVEIQELISRAQGVGYAEAWLDAGLFVQVLDQRDPRAGAAFDAASLGDKALAERRVREADVVRYSTGHRRIRDRRETFSGQAPLALFPYDLDHVTDICTGRLDVTITADCRAIERQFARRGITAQVATGREAGDLFVSCERAGRRISIPAPTREQVLVEGLTIETVVDIADWLLERPGPAGERRRQMALGFEERELWQPLDAR
jgi:hypothetical protein